MAGASPRRSESCRAERRRTFGRCPLAALLQGGLIILRSLLVQRGRGGCLLLKRRRREHGQRLLPFGAQFAAFQLKLLIFKEL